MTMVNLLSAGPLIVARLKAQIPELCNNVFSSGDLEGVTEDQQIVPAVHVVYNGDRISDSQGMKCEQEWYVIVVVRNTNAMAESESVQLDAGTLALKVIKALRGWSPTDEREHSVLKRVTGVRPGFHAGFGYFPLCFTTTVIV